MLTSTRNVGDYVVEFLAVTRKVEGHVLTPYYDRAPKNAQGQYQNVTIGDGINIDWSNTYKLKLVLAQLGLVDSSTVVEANRRLLAGEPAETAAERTARLDAMIAAFKQVMINNRPPEGAPEATVNAQNVILAGQLNSLSALFGGPQFALDRGPSEVVVRQILAGGTIPGFGGTFEGKEEALDRRLGQTASNQNVLAHNTREYVAVMSLFYNTPANAPFDSKLVRALQSDNRAEAWFEIRYNTNKGALSATPSNIVAGLAKRRYYESEVFGLYDIPNAINNPALVGVEEAKRIYRKR